MNTSLITLSIPPPQKNVVNTLVYVNLCSGKGLKLSDAHS